MSQLTRRAFISGAGATGLGLALAACSTPSGGNTTRSVSAPAETSTGPDDTLAKARKAGSITVAFINSKPLTYVDENTGKLTGSGPAVLTTIMKSLGVDSLNPVLVDFSALIPGLTAKRWDMSAFPFYITPTRCSQVAFTDPTARYIEGALVQTGNPKKIHSYPDLAKPDVKVAIQSGNAEIDWAKSAGVQQSQIQLFEEESLAVEAVRQKRADVYLNARFSLVQDLKNYGANGLEIADPFTGPIVDGKEVVAYGGWALRSDDTTLRTAFNEQLAALLKSGELLRLQQPFGYAEVDMPKPGTTAASLCPSASWAK